MFSHESATDDELDRMCDSLDKINRALDTIIKKLPLMGLASTTKAGQHAQTTQFRMPVIKKQVGNIMDICEHIEIRRAQMSLPF